jgi:hypothetical protein
MKKIFLLLVCVIVVGCREQTNKTTNINADSTQYPLLIDSGKKIIYKYGRMTERGWQVYLDTVTFTKGQLYYQDSIRHPLQQFRLSYPEWETISCVIAVDENDYWDKSMIGLIEKSGKLRISYQGKKLHLTPITPVKMKAGTWTGTFKSGSLEIQISGELDNKRILSCLTGQGHLTFKTPTKIIKETIFLVYKQ